MAIKVGNMAPAFSLVNQDEKKVSVKDLAGQWVVLYFYPKDDTPGCTTEACEFTEQLPDFEKVNARVIGVSPDSPESHRRFREKHQLSIELLSDPEHTMLEKYGAWGEKNRNGKIGMGVIRSTVVIDPEGRVRHHWPKVKAPGHAQTVQEKLVELQASR